MATNRRPGTPAGRALSRTEKSRSNGMLHPTPTPPTKRTTPGFVTRSSKSGQFISASKNATPQVRRAHPAGPDYAPRIRNVVGVLGTNSALAEFLEVSRSRITKWLTGAERPSMENARELLDLDHIISRAALVLHQDEIQSWLSSPNPFIPGNSSPLSAIRTGHVDDALSAIEAEAEGAYS